MQSKSALLFAIALVLVVAALSVDGAFFHRRIHRGSQPRLFTAQPPHHFDPFQIHAQLRNNMNALMRTMNANTIMNNMIAQQQEMFQPLFGQPRTRRNTAHITSQGLQEAVQNVELAEPVTNPMQKLLRVDPETSSCYSDPKSLFTPGQFAELSMKYANACPYWRSLEERETPPAAANSTEVADIAATQQEKDRFLKGLFSNTITYTISEDESDSDAHTITENAQTAVQHVTDDDMVITEQNHDDVQDGHQQATVSKSPEDNAPVAAAKQPARQQSFLTMQFAYTTSDLDADLPRYDAEMTELVEALGKQHHGQKKFKFDRSLKYSAEEMKCQKEHFSTLMNDICVNDNRTTQEKLNVVYNEQLQQRIRSLQNAQQRFETDIISTDNDRIQKRRESKNVEANAATTEQPDATKPVKPVKPLARVNSPRGFRRSFMNFPF